MEEKKATPPKKRVTFYVDGFNFYYGLRDQSALDSSWKKYYWIDLVFFFEQFLKPDEELIEVRYFTARPKNNGKMTRQNLFMEVNKKLHKGKFKIHYGKYQEKHIKCLGTCKDRFVTYEEKETDVHIAVKLIEDCVFGASDRIVLVSADSDLMPPIRFIADYCKKNNLEKDMTILFPPMHYSSALNNFGYPVIQLGKYESRFKKALLPKTVNFKDNSIYQIPANWDIEYPKELADKIFDEREKILAATTAPLATKK